MPSDVKPCPFCGKRPSVKSEAFPVEIRCADCGYAVRTFRHDLAYITRVWNERADHAE